MPIIPLQCPFCGGNLQINSDHDAAVCQYCNRPFIVKDAIVNNYINNVTNINAENVNIYTQKDFVIEAGVLKEYKGESVDVVIPDNVKYIGDDSNSFSGPFSHKMIERITIHSGVVGIGKYAFYDCKKLRSIKIPDSVTNIGERAFLGCTNLAHVTLPNGLTHISDYAFNECKALTSITIPKSVKTIGSGAFADCTGLTNVIIPDGVTRIGYTAFENCINLTSIEIPESVEGIEFSAFKGCNNLVSVIAPERLILEKNRNGNYTSAFRGTPFLTDYFEYNNIRVCPNCLEKLPLIGFKCPRCGTKRVV